MKYRLKTKKEVKMKIKMKVYGFQQYNMIYIIVYFFLNKIDLRLT